MSREFSASKTTVRINNELSDFSWRANRACNAGKIGALINHELTIFSEAVARVNSGLSIFSWQPLRAKAMSIKHELLIFARVNHELFIFSLRGRCAHYPSTLGFSW